MKLELKYLASYLPYKVLVGDGRAPFELTEHNFTNIFPYITEIYLHPLSDLTKEIEVNGEKFVPFKKLGWGNGTQVVPTILNGKINHNESQQLIEWHFDIYELIEAGLAIDINTL